MSNDHVHPIFQSILKAHGLIPQEYHSLADFLYRIAAIADQPILLIWDQDLGNKSVTNDIENVVNEIARAEKMVVSQFRSICFSNTYEKRLPKAPKSWHGLLK